MKTSRSSSLNVQEDDHKKKSGCRPLGKKNTIRVVFIVFFACAGFVGGYFIPAAESPPGTEPPPTAYIVVANIVLFIESAVLGAGFSFIITYASSVKKAPKKLKTKIMLTYITISWLLVQWWPHAQLHKYFGFDLNAIVGLEMTFHWVNDAALAILAVYQFQIILMCIALHKTKENLARLERGEKTRDEEKKEKQADRNCCERFWRNIKVHIAIITIVAAAIMYFGVSKAFDRGSSGAQLPDVFVALLIVIDVVSALFFGVGCAWAILAAIAIARKVSPQHQRPAWASYVAIAYIFLSDWFHGKAHFYVLPGDWWGLLVIEIVFHCGITAAGLILVYYQRKIITGYRKKNKRDGNTVSTNSGSVSQTSTDKKFSSNEKASDAKKSSTDDSESEAKKSETAPQVVTQVTPAQTARAEIDKSESSDHESAEKKVEQPMNTVQKSESASSVSDSGSDVSEISSSDNDSDDS